MANNLEVGTTIGDYQIIGILGAGGMGKVYKVRNVISDRVEALKVLLPDLATEADLADRFIREIKVQASLEHPNIASLHTALRVDNQLLMLMEFVEGMSLDQRLRQGPLPMAEAVDYIVQVLGALGYAHQHGVIHRDIKPANMMLTPGGVVKLMDFGIAKAATDRKLTMTGTTMGSLYYMSPEQIKGAATLDSRADLYSIGVALYELVTGKRPFDGDSQFAIMAAHLEKNPVPPISIDPRLPAELNDIILLSVAKDAGARFQSAEAFRNALVNVQAMVGRPAGAMPTAAMGGAAAPQTAAQAPPPIAAMVPPEAAAGGKSYRGLWLALGTLFTALVVVGIIQFGPWKKASAGSPPPAAAAPAQVTPPVVAPPAAGAGGESAPQQTAPARAVPADRATPFHPGGSGIVRNPPREVVAPAVGGIPPAPVAARPAQATGNTAPAPEQRPPAPSAAATAALQSIREQLALVSTRATVARASLDTLRRSQAALGLNLRGDIAEAASLANTYVEGANAALNAGDAAKAKDFMDKAERQVEKIETFLGR